MSVIKVDIMSHISKSTNDKRNNSHSEKKLLDVYYYIDFDDTTQEVSLVEQCLRLNIQVDQRDYQINKFINCKETTNATRISHQDIIKRGLLIFNRMFRKLKLKGNVDIWFVYIANGNINETYKDVFVGLVNTNPCIKTSNYIITKRPINVLGSFDKQKKLQEIRRLNSSLKELFCSQQTITYTNLLDGT